MFILKLEKYVAEHIHDLISDYEKIEFIVFVSAESYSVEFFVTNNGERKQNFDLIDEGVISEDKFDVFAKNTAEFVRNLPDFIKGKVNKFAFDLCSNDKTT